MRHRRKLLGGYYVVCFLAVVWPGYAWLGNRLEPFVFGLPFSFAYNIGWVLLSFVVLLGFHLTEREQD